MQCDECEELEDILRLMLEREEGRAFWSLSRDARRQRSHLEDLAADQEEITDITRLKLHQLERKALGEREVINLDEQICRQKIKAKLQSGHEQQDDDAASEVSTEYDEEEEEEETDTEEQKRKKEEEETAEVPEVIEEEPVAASNERQQTPEVPVDLQPSPPQHPPLTKRPRQRELPPPANPDRINVTNIKQHSATVRWARPPHCNGRKLQYRILLSSDEGDSFYAVASSRDQFYKFKDLLAAKKYQVSVTSRALDARVDRKTMPKKCTIVHFVTAPQKVPKIPQPPDQQFKPVAAGSVNNPRNTSSLYTSSARYPSVRPPPPAQDKHNMSRSQPAAGMSGSYSPNYTHNSTVTFGQTQFLASNVSIPPTRANYLLSNSQPINFGNSLSRH
eukprot:TRINITY_DN66818_c5_g1_i1.p1 TRINITY_DN66818_c5_g1~~TRINITY_DN66818_c5_g1_i1.p1  ORF type:complete len:391 (+),score=49.83 TRINITY_DN66818_c5_g1_i1:960-2132(+)